MTLWTHWQDKIKGRIISIILLRRKSVLVATIWNLKPWIGGPKILSFFNRFKNWLSKTTLAAVQNLEICIPFLEQSRRAAANHVYDLILWPLFDRRTLFFGDQLETSNCRLKGSTWSLHEKYQSGAKKLPNELLWSFLNPYIEHLLNRFIYRIKIVVQII